MIPALIFVALLILLGASRAAENAEEAHREAAGDAEPDSWSWRTRVGMIALGIFLLPLAVAVYALPEILF